MDPNDSSSILPAHEFISEQIERERREEESNFVKNGEKI